MKKILYLSMIVSFVWFAVSCKQREHSAKQTPEAVSLPTQTVETNQNKNIVGKHWRLIELEGKPVFLSQDTKKEPHIVLHQEGNRVSGNAGCNNIVGSYELDEKTFKIRFAQMATTKMMCIDMNMDIETRFLKALETVDNYSLSSDGKTLSLNRARMSPLARFEVVN